MSMNSDGAYGLRPGRGRNLARLLFYVLIGIPHGRHRNPVRRLLISVHQLTWGLLNTVVGLLAGGFCVLVLGGQVFRWHSATVVVLPGRTVTAATLGPVIIGLARLPDDVLDHELGHWYQSIVLGPLYFLLVGLPSVAHFVWFATRRSSDPFAYYRFYTEAWADAWGGTWEKHRHAVRHWSDYLRLRRAGARGHDS